MMMMMMIEINDVNASFAAEAYNLTVASRHMQYLFKLSKVSLLSVM